MKEIKGADTFIFGHTPAVKPLKFANQMYIDTGAVFCGNLTLIQVQEKAHGHKRTKPHQRAARVAEWLA